MSPPSAAAALRESFGDRRPPDITRKITACVACRKRKVKCHMTDGNPPCSRCRTRGLPCTVNKSIQMLLEDDATWKEKIEERINQIEASLPSESNVTSDQNGVETASSLQHVVPQATAEQDSSSASGANNDATLNLSCSLGAFPASSFEGALLDDTPRAISSSTAPATDFTASFLPADSLLTSASAEQHFDFYRKALDQAIHYLLSQSDTLTSVISRSRLLAVAICTVAAFCTNSEDCSEWLNSFRNMVANKIFSNRHSFDDVRALCIGAFWISDLSTPLNALAVRLSSELNLHRCITKLPHTKRECYVRTRLYFLVYIVDHHCSISYGRPPMTRELPALKNARLLLRCEFCDPTRGDLALVGQVELWGISAQVFDLFGADIERDISSFASDLEKFTDAYKAWKLDWEPVLLPLNHLFGRASRSSTTHFQDDGQPFELYLAAAKLYLFSHAFRGPAQRQSQPPVAAATYTKLHKCGCLAVDSARKIINHTADMVEAGPNFRTLPVYLATMVAFACVVTLRTSHLQHLDTGEADIDVGIDHVKRLSNVLQQSLQPQQGQSSLSHQPNDSWVKIAKGLKSAWLNGTISTNTSQDVTAQPGNVTAPDHRELNTFMFHSPHGALDIDAFALGLSSNIDNGFPGDFGFEFDWMNFEGSALESATIDIANINTPDQD